MEAISGLTWGAGGGNVAIPIEPRGDSSNGSALRLAGIAQLAVAGEPDGSERNASGGPPSIPGSGPFNNGHHNPNSHGICCAYSAKLLNLRGGATFILASRLLEENQPTSVFPAMRHP